MNIKQVREKSLEELDKELTSLYREQFNLRMHKGSGELAKPSEFKKVRRLIARIKTIMNEKRRTS